MSWNKTPLKYIPCGIGCLASLPPSSSLCSLGVSTSYGWHVAGSWTPLHLQSGPRMASWSVSGKVIQMPVSKWLSEVTRLDDHNQAGEPFAEKDELRSRPSPTGPEVTRYFQRGKWCGKVARPSKGHTGLIGIFLPGCRCITAARMTMERTRSLQLLGTGIKVAQEWC
jgi:hypothetical protein